MTTVAYVDISDPNPWTDQDRWNDLVAVVSALLTPGGGIQTYACAGPYTPAPTDPAPARAIWQIGIYTADVVACQAHLAILAEANPGLLISWNETTPRTIPAAGNGPTAPPGPAA